jgi:hypothetical protein
VNKIGVNFFGLLSHLQMALRPSANEMRMNFDKNLFKFMIPLESSFASGDRLEMSCK